MDKVEMRKDSIDCFGPDLILLSDLGGYGRAAQVACSVSGLIPF